VKLCGDDNITLQPAADGVSGSCVALLYSSLCSLLVLGDDLSHVDSLALHQRLDRRSAPSSLLLSLTILNFHYNYMCLLSVVKSRHPVN